jgi:hypothetical protein
MEKVSNGLERLGLLRQSETMPQHLSFLPDRAPSAILDLLEEGLPYELDVDRRLHPLLQPLPELAFAVLPQSIRQRDILAG